MSRMLVIDVLSCYKLTCLQFANFRLAELLNNKFRNSNIEKNDVLKICQ